MMIIIIIIIIIIIMTTRLHSQCVVVIMSRQSVSDTTIKIPIVLKASKNRCLSKAYNNNSVQGHRNLVVRDITLTLL